MHILELQKLQEVLEDNANLTTEIENLKQLRNASEEEGNAKNNALIDELETKIANMD
eukprot:Awhi_evm1s8304